MFEKLLSTIAEWGMYFSPIVICNQYETGIILRLGIFKRRMKLGLQFKWPLVETYLKTYQVTTTTELKTQTLTTTDSISVIVKAVLSYEIHDPKLYFLGMYGWEDAIIDIGSASIRQVITHKSRKELSDCDDEIFELAHADLWQYGVNLKSLSLVELATAKVFRLVTDSNPYVDD